MKIIVDKSEIVSNATGGDIIGITYLNRDHEDDYYLLLISSTTNNNLGYLYDLGNGSIYDDQGIETNYHNMVNIKDLQTYVGSDRKARIIINAELIIRE